MKMTAERISIASCIEALRGDYNWGLTWGVRYDLPGLPVGHIFPPSQVYGEDQLPTGELLPGTSVVDDLLVGLVYGENCYIVAGYFVEAGNDSGEAVLSECEVMEVWASTLRAETP